MTLLTACGSDELSEPLTRDYKTYIGEIKSLGGIEVQESITHLFETEDGEILYAYSDRYDLDDEDYLETEVKAYGVVTTYDNLEKSLFEIKQISAAPEEDEETKEVTDVSYQDPDLGFSISYPSDWTISTTPDSVVLVAPEAVAEEELIEESSARDQIVIGKTGATLAKTSDDPQDDRATEVRDFVKTHYATLASLESELTYVGTDRLLGVKYKADDGDTYYFVPRGTELFELSYDHQTESDSERVTNSNVFSKLLSGFRFIPYGESDETVVDEPEEEEEDPIEDSGTSTTEQVSFSSYRDLESKSFAFKMSYPGLWYYSGSSTGYLFDDAAIEDGATEGIIEMAFASSGTEGVKRSSETVTVTVEVNGRYYVLTGGAEYEDVMKTMAESITSTATEE
jgi:hypothetical protein